MCNSGIEADNHHLLESLAACDKRPTKLTVYFAINLAFSNYLELMPNITDQLTLVRDKTDHEQLLPIYLNVSHCDNSLSDRPDKLKEFVCNYIHSTNNKEIFDLQKRHTIYTFSPFKNFFLNKIVNIFTFTSSIISIITITLVIYLFCKHKHIRTIVASLLLHKAKEVEARTPTKIDNSECSTLAYIGIDSNIIKYGNSHPFALQKIKILQRIQILKHCKNSIVHLRCAALYTNKTLQDIRKSSPIQNHRHIDIRRYKVE